MANTIYFSEQQILADFQGISRVRLQGWIKEGIVRPRKQNNQFLFDEADWARLALIRTLCEDFDMCDEALYIFTTHLDQLHSLRADMRRLLHAIAEQPDEVRAAIKKSLDD